MPEDLRPTLTHRELAVLLELPPIDQSQVAKNGFLEDQFEKTWFSETAQTVAADLVAERARKSERIEMRRCYVRGQMMPV